MINKQSEHYIAVMEYAQSVVDGRKIANVETIQMAERFLRDLDNDDYVFTTKDPDFIIDIIQKTFVHDKGQAMDGTSLRGKPFLLEPWQKFIVYNLVGFLMNNPGAITQIRRFQEAFIFLPRKNGKTSFIAALSWALALLERESGSTVYIVGAALRQAKQAFNFIHHNIKQMGETKSFRILANNQEHSISGSLGNGSIHIEALAATPDRQDSLNCNIAIADEMHAYKSSTQYDVIKEAMKAYRNKLMIGITTAGDNANSFCFKRLQYCQKILSQTVTDERYFVFIAKADEDENGDVDYLDPINHEKANPNYGVTIDPDEIAASAQQAQSDPQSRKDFLSKELNKYTSAMNAYFNLDEFTTSNAHTEDVLGLAGLTHAEKVKKLSKLKDVKWYGGADLSKMHDLTAVALYGVYKDIDIVLSHAFFPVVKAAEKANDDGIPLFGWKDDGVLTMSNASTTNHQDVIRWFMDMRKLGFNIASIGFDKKFGREFYLGMKRQKFKIQDAPQYFHKKSEGFRRIERRTKEKRFCYLGSQAFEYCVLNVKGVERTDDAILYEKILDDQRIDIFDASVFASMEYLESLTATPVGLLAGRYNKKNA